MSSLYVHIPFCLQKCPYCDFFSQVGTAQQIDAYVDLLITHLSVFRNEGVGPFSPLKTIFFGGGTPSLLSVEQLNTLLNQIKHTFSFEDYPEISLEANPGTVTAEKLHGYRQAGVNRLSIGVQSLDDNNLQTLGRIHNVEQVAHTVTSARDAGFDNISLDLMFGLPGQSTAALEREVVGLLGFFPEHISLYGLSYEEGTDFYWQRKAGKLVACADDLYAEQYQFIHDLLTDGGFIHYEISNFSRSTHQCRHNLNYWQRQTCHALGAGGHSFVDSGWGERWHVPADLKRYAEVLRLGENPAEFLEGYDRDSAMREYVYLTLRTRNGLDLKQFEEKFDCSFTQKFSFELLKIGDYIKIDPKSGSYSFTTGGWLIYDHLISHFL